MSLKFGIYLVEQRIISPEQFCGLVKIQQDASISMPSLAIRRNFMTIRQVAEVLDLAENHPEKTFLQLAIEQDLIEPADADQMLHLQQLSSPDIRKLVVDCGLLTRRQTAVLFSHFEKPATARPAATEPDTAADSESGERNRDIARGPRAPKFQQHNAADRATLAQPESR